MAANSGEWTIGESRVFTDSGLESWAAGEIILERQALKMPNKAGSLLPTINYTSEISEMQRQRQ